MLISKETPKEVIIKEFGSKCELCGHCCHFASGVVLDEEIPRLAKHFSLKPKEFKEIYLEKFTKFNTQLHRFKQIRKGNAPHGRCIFLDVEENKCSINEIKPLHCRISTCAKEGEEVQKWFDANYFLNADDEISLREYGIYLKFNEPLIGAELKTIVSKENK